VSILNKTYDGTNSAGSVTLGDLSGFVGNERVTATASATALIGTDVGTYNTTVRYTLGDGANGGLASNYTLAETQNVEALITAKALSVTGVSILNKTYDGTNSAGSVTLGDLSGFVGNERVTATASATALIGTDVGTYNTTVRYTLGDVANEGLASNYTLADTQNVEASITAKALSVTGVRPPSFVYSKDSSFGLEGNPRIAPYEKDNVSLAGTAVGYVLTADVARDVPVTIAGLTLIGCDRKNYRLLFPSGFFCRCCAASIWKYRWLERSGNQFK
jgi:hypothetical protein